MRALQRRLRKLESTVHDSSGLLPGSKAWRAYWRGQMENYLAGQPAELFPIEVVRLWVQDPQSLAAAE